MMRRSFLCAICLICLSLLASPRTHADEHDLQKLLKRWQSDCDKLQGFECSMETWESDPVFRKKTHTLGRLAHAVPGRWVYHVQYDASGAKVVEKPGLHFAIDQGNFYEFRHQERTLVEYRDLFRRVQAVNENSRLAVGIFGVLSQSLRLGRMVFHPDPAELERLYTIRERTMDDETTRGQVWLEFVPKDELLLRCQKRVEIILSEQPLGDERLLYVYAVRQQFANGSDATHAFTKFKLNPEYTEATTPFRLKAPRGWEHRLEKNVEP